MEDLNQKGENSNDITLEQFREQCEKIRMRVAKLAETRDKLLDDLSKGNISDSEVSETWKKYDKISSLLRKFDYAESNLIRAFCAQAVKRLDEAERKLRKYLDPISTDGNDETELLL